MLRQHLLLVAFLLLVPPPVFSNSTASMLAKSSFIDDFGDFLEAVFKNIIENSLVQILILVIVINVLLFLLLNCICARCKRNKLNDSNFVTAHTVNIKVAEEEA